MKPRAEWWRNALLAIGIFVPAEGPLRAKLTARFFVLLGAGALAALIGALGFAKYSTSPNFCRSCHIMEPYYKAWATSKHNQVACVECHYPPGTPQTHLWHKFQAMSQVVKYVTRTYSSKPFAEVEDASCLRSGCHSQRLLQGRVVSKEMGIHFDHRPHLEGERRGRKLRCTSCHSQMVVGNHLEVTYGTCFLCHFKGKGTGRDLKPIGGCRACHDVPSKDIRVGNMTYNHKNYVLKQGLDCQNCHVDVVRGEGKAPQDRCFTCHNQPEKVKRYGDTAFIHDNHVAEHNIACHNCHEDIQHGFKAGGKLSKLLAAPPPGVPSMAAVSTATLPAGHTPTLAFECSFCHQDKHTGQR
ncbi:MAG: NapC/NirT family cytochrome c, partial [Elusimicrobia bacterium]|nr:NapC/NirT family cytochrome c [Elusimicrobiota bacterium]